ncbi:hypothetical protein DEU56DRAFT_758672 [Suillus clintonianus]|uniref:uncharacterized protein n=1 Tax=Suillus clintonianus TaxID=1904413 RepID=UPI001B8649E7|nr:uncharacterized protein DEU56DRAFT_758672 [Suillus clintonianus]KAG2127231.1 hypothetical protein DEU56DRAFT_758672 [Suillus clintonianus]
MGLEIGGGSLEVEAQALTILHWSQLSDHIGRKPLILTALFIIAVSMFSFELSKTFFWSGGELFHSPKAISAKFVGCFVEITQNESYALRHNNIYEAAKKFRWNGVAIDHTELDTFELLDLDLN